MGQKGGSSWGGELRQHWGSPWRGSRGSPGGSHCPHGGGFGAAPPMLPPHQSGAALPQPAELRLRAAGEEGEGGGDTGGPLGGLQLGLRRWRLGCGLGAPFGLRRGCFGSVWAQMALFWVTLPPFWAQMGLFWVTLGSFWAQMGCFGSVGLCSGLRWGCFGLVWLHFGLRLGCFGSVLG